MTTIEQALARIQPEIRDHLEEAVADARAGGWVRRRCE